MKRILIAIAMLGLTGGAYAGAVAEWPDDSWPPIMSMNPKTPAAGLPVPTVVPPAASVAAAAASTRLSAKLYPHSCFRKGHSLVETGQFDEIAAGNKVRTQQFAQLDDLERIFLFSFAHKFTPGSSPYVSKGEFSRIAIFIEAGADNSLVFYTAPEGSYSETIVGVGIRYFPVPSKLRKVLHRFTPEEMQASADAAPSCR
ncbi:MAG: hypothetical protein NTY45_08140 [Elusimicrobia bacterium]|nr:hypothetical protein [Elusimicrobiota bacterium]